MIISFQCFVLRSKGKSVMIDTCIGADRKRDREGRQQFPDIEFV